MWEQEGALRDVRVPAHVPQSNTRVAQTREKIFPTPKKVPSTVLILKLAISSIFLPRGGGKKGEDLTGAPR